MVTIKFKETGSEYELRKGPAAALALSVTAAGLIAAASWNKISLPEVPVPAAAAGKDPQPGDSSSENEPSDLAEKSSIDAGATPASIEAPTLEPSTLPSPNMASPEKASPDKAAEVAQGVFSLPPESLIEWGKSFGESASTIISRTVTEISALAQEKNGDIPSAGKLADSKSEQLAEIDVGSLLDLPAISLRQPNKVPTEPDPSMPEWVVQSAREMGITDLSAVKEVAEGEYAYCFEGSCTPITKYDAEKTSRDLSVISPLIGGEYSADSTAGADDVSQIIEEPVAPPVPAQSNASSEAQEDVKTEAPMPHQGEQTQQPAQPEKVVEIPQKIEVQEPKITPLEFKTGVVEGLDNGAVVVVTENGKTGRVTLSLGPNIVGTPIRFEGMDLGTASRIRSSDSNITLKVNPNFKGTLELVPRDTLVGETIKRESPSLIIIDGASRNTPYVKDAIAAVLEENRENIVLFVKSVPGPCTPCTTYQPELKLLAERIQKEGLTLGGRKVVVVEALFTSFADAHNALGKSTVPRTDLIIPVDARRPTTAPLLTKVLEYESVSFIGFNTAAGVLNWANEKFGK